MLIFQRVTQQFYSCCDVSAAVSLLNKLTCKVWPFLQGIACSHDTEAPEELKNVTLCSDTYETSFLPSCWVCFLCSRARCCGENEKSEKVMSLQEYFCSVSIVERCRLWHLTMTMTLRKIKVCSNRIHLKFSQREANHSLVLSVNKSLIIMNDFYPPQGDNTFCSKTASRYKQVM